MKIWLPIPVKVIDFGNFLEQGIWPPILAIESWYTINLTLTSGVNPEDANNLPSGEILAQKFFPKTVSNLDNIAPFKSYSTMSVLAEHDIMNFPVQAMSMAIVSLPLEWSILNERFAGATAKQISI